MPKHLASGRIDRGAQRFSALDGVNRKATDIARKLTGVQILRKLDDARHDGELSTIGVSPSKLCNATTGIHHIEAAGLLDFELAGALVSSRACRVAGSRY